ncbi:STAS/SEC14 domain-containing protein [Sphingomonas sp. ID1715]|uniref:STAS/SEC14 domain-containing protein n=1 Tax=Sphingomonas sp. ID1715 TaxID=1656898 RepID=UPI001487AFC8|nr:STAS/SEC14 domain-containing protein [Sphingomonas sp. ID1715]NNM76457.1 STAS/SEC14 domain-containing protein [Sphingomonas sp. ID1715]
MIEFLNAPEDVIALAMSHKITGNDLDSIMERLESMMERGGKVHVFVETKHVDGIELSGLRRYMARALPLFGKLRRFGRVAVVSDQAWIRWGTRIESGLLPFIAYRVFEPAESGAALAWVKGERQ